MSFEKLENKTKKLINKTSEDYINMIDKYFDFKKFNHPFNECPIYSSYNVGNYEAFKSEITSFFGFTDSVDFGFTESIDFHFNFNHNMYYFFHKNTINMEDASYSYQELELITNHRAILYFWLTWMKKGIKRQLGTFHRDLGKINPKDLTKMDGLSLLRIENVITSIRYTERYLNNVIDALKKRNFDRRAGQEWDTFKNMGIERLTSKQWITDILFEYDLLRQTYIQTYDIALTISQSNTFNTQLKIAKKALWVALIATALSVKDELIEVATIIWDCLISLF